MSAMRSRCAVRHALLSAVAAILVAGCVAPPRPFTEEFYAPLRVRRDATIDSTVAVFAFADERPESEPTVILVYEPYNDRPRVERSTTTVGEGVARAFARGLHARGFSVVDATRRPYQAGATPNARAIVTGRVAEFGAKLARTGFISGYQQHVGIRLAVDVHDAATGRRLTERTYQRVVEGAMTPAEPLMILSRVLADVVEQAIADRELLAALRS